MLFPLLSKLTYPYTAFISGYQTYGYNYLPLLLSLSRLSLFNKPPTSASSSTKPLFTSLRKSLRLIVDDVDETAPNDISFVYSGYAPMSIRLVQCVAQKAAVLSTPVAVSSESGSGGAGSAVPRAHPIVGWKGFEDVLASEYALENTDQEGEEVQVAER